MKYADLLSAVRKVRIQKFNADVAVFYPTETEDLVNELKAYNVFGSPDALFKGEIGKAGGVRILETTHMYPGVGIVLDTRRSAIYTPKRKLSLIRDEKPNLDATAIYLYLRAGVGVARPEAIAVITGMQTDAV